MALIMERSEWKKVPQITELKIKICCDQIRSNKAIMTIPVEVSLPMWTWSYVHCWSPGIMLLQPYFFISIFVYFYFWDFDAILGQTLQPRSQFLIPLLVFKAFLWQWSNSAVTWQQWWLLPRPSVPRCTHEIAIQAGWQTRQHWETENQCRNQSGN